MAKYGTAARKGLFPRRVYSKYPPEVRARMMAETIRELQAKHIAHPEVAHLTFLLVHGHDPRQRIALEIARPHMDSETVAEIMRDALGAYASWGQQEFPSSAVVNSFGEAVSDAIHNLCRVDPFFGETVLLCVHPDGAACLAMFLAHGKSTDFVRRMMFDALYLKYEKAPKGVEKIL